MLIYNYKKEFLGIDESDLEALGLSDLTDLRAEAGDFADLFVKTPGHIHNFKHVHWIDYITCNETGVASKAIINVRNKNYATNIDIQTIYLVDSPSKKAYIINLSNIRPLSQTQSEKISTDISQRTAPTTISEPTELFTTPGSIIHEESQEAAFDPYEANIPEQDPNVIDDIYESKTAVEDLASDEPLDIDFGDEEIEIEDFQDTEIEKTDETEAVVKDDTEVDKDDPFSDYVFNPQVASEELGLPTDLVEEFIQDFIAQANSFKKELYESTERSDLDNVKIQSHKLKGVAANLRIEDALDALTIINSSENTPEINKNLNRLYRIIDKLANPNTYVATSTEVEDIKTDDEDDFVLSFKEDAPQAEDISSETSSEPEESTEVDEISLAEDVNIETPSESKKSSEIDDSEVPESIDIVELEDDMFLKQDTSALENEVDDEDLSILDNASDIEENDIQEEALDIAISYDKELIANDIGLDIDSFNELFEDYINESKELTTSMENAIKDDDANAYKSSAIKLKGMSENMRIHKFDSELETIINSSDISSTSDSLENIVLKLEQISTIGDQ